jgi:phospholipase/lecithinase/hemolysin
VRPVYTDRSGTYLFADLQHPCANHTHSLMRAEIHSLLEAAKQSIGLLRRHL